jgi:hypothetical protein
VAGIGVVVGDGGVRGERAGRRHRLSSERIIAPGGAWNCLITAVALVRTTA